MATSEIFGDAANAILEKAVEFNMPLRLTLSKEGKVHRYAARFLAFSQQKEKGRTRVLGLPTTHQKRVILVERPRPEGHTLPVTPGDELEAYFVQGELYYAFMTRDQGDTVHELREGKKVPAVALAWPRGVVHIQQREAFRVEISVLAPIDVILVRPYADEEIQAQLEGRSVTSILEQPPPETESLPVVGDLVDISDGGAGIRFRLEGGPEEDIRVGHRVRLAFTLPNIALQNLHGEVKHVRLQEGTGDTEFKILGVEFDPADLEPIVETLRDWIMERQREILKKRK